METYGDPTRSDYGLSIGDPSTFQLDRQLAGRLVSKMTGKAAKA